MPSVHLKEYVTNTVKTATPSNISLASTLLYPITDYVSLDRFSTAHKAFQAAIILEIEPTSYKQAIKRDVWTKAMGSEIDAHQLNHTWDITTLPPGKKAIGNKWVYKVKFRSDGTVERYKARLVALGNRQMEGEDYGDTFAPVAKMNTVRLFLQLASGRGWQVHQIDVHNAFLHGELGEEVYMKLPQDFKATSPGQVCRLRKSLYGLKQAPRCWFGKLSKALVQYGFTRSRADYALFTINKDGKYLTILVYVDDLIITGNSEESKYALDIIAKAGLLGAKPSPFPLYQNQKLAISTSPFLPDPEPYRRLVGRLVYLKVTRPDLAFSVHTLAQFMQQPRQEHWSAALRVVRYLKNKPGQGILLKAETDFKISGWCDSD